MPSLDGIQSKKRKHFPLKKKKGFFSYLASFPLSFPSFFSSSFPKHYPFLTSTLGIILFSASSFLLLSFFFFSDSILGATYRFTQTSWNEQSTDEAQHPDNGDWNKYESKDTQILLGDSLRLESESQQLTQTSDTDFSQGIKTDLGIDASGDEASLGLLSALGAVAQVSAGTSHTCALKTDGTVWCWGYNNDRRLGDNTTITRYTPVQVLGVGGVGFLEGVSQISVGREHTCALKTDGTAYCWGRNYYGQLGDNTTIDQYTPVQVLGINGEGFLEGVSHISSGGSHTCAVKNNGTAWCWGSNGGQIGDNTQGNPSNTRYTPVQVRGVENVGFLESVSHISAGSSHTCAFKTDGTAYCWGGNSQGQLGDNTTTQRNTPVQVVGVDAIGVLEGILQISTGNFHTCATKTDETAYCWGMNSSGQLGDNTTTQRNTPVQVLGVGGIGFLENVLQISAGSSHTCAVKTDGTAYCWGGNSQGQLGDNTTTTRLTPLQVLGVGASGFLEGVSRISAGDSWLTCALTATNTVLCWGYNNYGQLGDNTTTTRRTPTETLDETSTFLSFTQNALQVANGIYHSCMLKEDFTVWCWGSNGSYGRLGDNTTTGKRTPVQVLGVEGVGFLEDVSGLSVGTDHTCARKNDGTVYCWGQNSNGQLGNNTTIDQYTPVQVVGVGAIGFLENVSQISAGSDHTCARKTDDTAYCWGYNVTGNLGDNTTTQRITPVQVKGVGNVGFLENVSQISAGSAYTCALKTDSAVYCWGSNTSGRLGDNTTTQRTTPVQVKNEGAVFLDPLSQSQKVGTGGSSSFSFSCTLREDTTVWCWGDNQYGQLGDGSTEIRPGAVQVKGVGGVGYLTGVSHISNGESHTCALKTDGTAYCWGRGNSGRLGDNTSIDRYTPVQVKGVGNVGFLEGILQISSGGGHTCALKTDGTMYCWGFNGSGRLGDNTTSSRSTPVQVKGVENVGFLEGILQISLGDSYTCAVKADGKAYCWGMNSSGQLGDNTTTQRNTPVQVLGVGGIGFLEGILQISLGDSQTCAVKTDGMTYCWGNNQYGQLGDNTTTQRNTPVQVLGVGASGFLEGVSQISVGDSHTCALKTDGTVYCWGRGTFGQLGDNTTTTQRNTPAQVVGVGATGFLQEISHISVGSYHVCAVKNTGETLCWGSNSSGQLGADTGNMSAPGEVFTYLPSEGFLEGIAHISTGNYVCAVKDDGTVYCWGGNDYGQLGDNTTTIQRNTPVQVLGVGGIGFLENVSQISVGSRQACATKTDDTSYCWGYNSQGQLGDNTTITRYTPVQVLDVGGVGFLQGVSQISVGDSHTCSLKTDGTTYCWGSNSYGQLADNTYTNSSTPVQTQLWTFPEDSFFLGTPNLSLSGTYTSPTFDLTKPVAFTTFSYQTTTNNQSISLTIGGGNTPTPDESWTEIENVQSGQDISSLSGRRYIYYKTTLTSDTLGETPFLNDITFSFNVFPASQSLIFSPFNSGDAGNVLGGLSWREDTNLPEGSNITFSVRSAPSKEDLSSSSWSLPITSESSNCQKQDDLVTCTHDALEENLKDGVNDQFFQYQVALASQGDTTPTLYETDFVYVVNAPPLLQNVTATPNQEKTIDITYQVKDPDTETGTNTPYFITPSFEYYNGSSWIAIEPEALSVSDLENKSVLSDTFTTHTATWTPSLSNDNLYLSGLAKVRVTISDNEGASNIASHESNFFTLDTKIPTNLSITVDASTQDLTLPATTSTLTLGVSDDSTTQMKISLDENLTDATWEPFSATKTITLQTDPDTIYVRFKDSYGNQTQTIHTQTPETPTRMITQDTSNMLLTPPEYRAFIGFKTIEEPTGGFGSYKLYRGQEEEIYSLLNTVFARENNYFSDNQV